MNEAAAIDAVFCPKSIAVVGASADPSKFGSQVLRNLQSSGFPGKLFPISRSPGEVCGLKPFASLRDLPQPVDLVLVSVPVQYAAATIEDAVVASARAAVVYTAGFQEIGEAGRAVQNDLLSRTGGKLRLVGPNCLGIRNFHLPMNASPMSQNVPAAGNIAFVSQSGAFGNAATAALGSARVGLSKLASIGNMADLTHAHFFRYLKDDPETAVIAAFVEGVPDVAAFLDAIADVTRSKPVVILKGGRSPAGQRAALSHTGSLAGDGRVWDSLLREAGATVAASSEDLFDAAAVFSRHGRQRIGGSRAAIFSLAGGPGVVAADHCDEVGITLPALGDKLGALRAIVPPFAALGNPVEVTGQTKREHLDACAKAIVAQPEVDAMIGIAIGLDFAEFANALIAANAVKPVVACVVAPQSEALLANGGVANFPSVDRAVRALGHLVARGAQTAPQAVAEAGAAVVRPLVPGLLSEAASKSYLAGYGLPVTDEQEVADGDAAVAAADRLGYPVVLKVSSAAIPHKSDVGGVHLNLGNGEAVRAAGAVLCERFPGIPLLVQKMVAPGLELIVGAKRTNETGAIVMVGIGGVFTEVLDDVVFCRAPARQENVITAMERLRSRRLLDGYRGGAAIDRMAVASIAARLSEIVAANPALREIDLNPVIASAAGAIIVDALIRSEGDCGAEAGR